MVSFYEDFVAKAAKGRGKTKEQIHAVAQGRVWTGEDAQKVGLVDRLGGLETALAVVREKAKLAPDQELNLVVLPEKKGFFETLMERQEEGANASLRAWPAEVRAALRWAAALGPGGPLARL